MTEQRETVEFTKEGVKEYLDEAIRYWRKRRDSGESIAAFYVDAFQSMRVSLFGEALEAE